jgi:hypothetical protein
MPYEPNDNSGSVFANKNKETDKQPDRTGSARIDGVDYWVSGWIKKTKDGENFLSLSFRPKDEDAKSNGKARQGAGRGRGNNGKSQDDGDMCF